MVALMIRHPLIVFLGHFIAHVFADAATVRVVTGEGANRGKDSLIRRIPKVGAYTRARYCDTFTILQALWASACLSDGLTRARRTNI